MQEPWRIHWQDYYAILQLHAEAEPLVIEKAYKWLASRYHPDVTATGDAERFKLISEAFEVLSDPAKRRLYDGEYRQRNGYLSEGVERETELRQRLAQEQEKLKRVEQEFQDVQEIWQLRDAGEDIRRIAFAPNNGYVILYGWNGYRCRNIPDRLANRLKDCNDKGEEIREIAFAPSGGYVIVWGRNAYDACDIPEALAEKLRECRDKGDEIRHIAFAPNGGYVIRWGQIGYRVSRISKVLNEKLKECHDKGEDIKQVAFGPSGGWVVLVGWNGFWHSGIPERMSSELSEYLSRKKEIRYVLFTPNSEWLIFGGKESQNQPAKTPSSSAAPMWHSSPQIHYDLTGSWASFSGQAFFLIQVGAKVTISAAGVQGQGTLVGNRLLVMLTMNSLPATGVLNISEGWRSMTGSVLCLGVSTPLSMYKIF